MERAPVGVVGCGKISSQYLENLVQRFPFFEQSLLVLQIPSFARVNWGVRRVRWGRTTATAMSVC